LSWTIQFTDQESTLVTEVINAASVSDQQAILDNAWGDWLLLEEASKIDIMVSDLETYDATGDDFNFILDFSSNTQIFAANINGFDTGDTVTITNAPDGVEALYDSSSATGIDFFYGDTTLSIPSWTIQFGDQDSTLVTEVINAASVSDQQVILDNAWGDWLWV
jgi:hypothetical protein